MSPMTAADAAISPAILPQQRPGKPLFTKENAAEFARRSAESRKRNAEAKELQRAQRLVRAAAVQDSEDYIASKLVQVRAQIALVDEMLEAASDAKEAKSCADALARLYEVESYLSGRPKPGSRRPGREKPARESRSTAPLDGVE